MKHTTIKSLIAFTLIALASGCKPKLTAPDPDKGSMDASRYVALGTSFTAGNADGALYYEGQKVSYAALIAEQFKTIGGGNFNIPYVPASSAGVAIDKNGNVVAKFKLQHATDCKGATSLMPVQMAATENNSFFTNSIYSSNGPFNNMGVPNAKAIDVNQAGYGGSNGFYLRMAANPFTASILSDAEAQNPTFFSLEIGLHDVLTYALAGGASDSITSVSRFNASIDSIIAHLTKNGAKGVIANIPDITILPHFTTIPYNGLKLSASQAEQLNTSTLNIFGFKEGVNPFIIEDPTSVVGGRPMRSTELLLLELPLDSVKCHGMGALTPIPNRYVLDETEIAAIRSAISAFNIKLRAVAQEKGLAFVDVNAFVQSAKSGIVHNGISLNAQFVKGGVFSLDGTCLNPIGNAMLANEFLKAINSTYGSTIPLVDVTKYRGTIFP